MVRAHRTLEENAMTWFVLGLVATNLTLCVVHSVFATKYRRMIRGTRSTTGDSDNPDFSTAAAEQSAALSASGKSGTSRPDSGLTETTADVPILAYKCASLGWQPGGVFYLESYGNDAVKAEMDARCEHYRGAFLTYPSKPPDIHRAPGVECNCGFHAVRTMEDAKANGYGLVTLEVELSGRVVVHDKGYRAEHQRVLRVHLPRCWFCGEGAAAIWLKERDQGPCEARPLCADHSSHGDVIVRIEKVMAELGLPWENAA